MRKKNESSHIKQILCFSKHNKSALCAVVLGDELVSSSFEGDMKFWDMSTGACVAIIPKAHRKAVRVLLANPSRGQIISASDDHSLKVWKADTRQLQMTLTGHNRDVRAAILWGDRCVISASADYSIRVWSLEDGTCLRTMKGHLDWISCIVLLNEHYLLSGSCDHTVRLWDLRSGRCVNIFREGKQWIIDIQLMGSTFITLSFASHLTVRHFPDGQVVRVIQAPEYLPIFAALNFTLIMGYRDGTIAKWCLF